MIAAALAVLVAAAPCEVPTLDFRAAPSLDATEQARFAANFRVALGRACDENLFAEEPLIDPRSADKSTLFVLDAPEANVTSIYFHVEGQPPRTMIEAPFGEPPHVPSAEELHEAIYCAVRGATAEEQETTGRCLVD